MPLLDDVLALYEPGTGRHVQQLIYKDRVVRDFTGQQEPDEPETDPADTPDPDPEPTTPDPDPTEPTPDPPVLPDGVLFYTDFDGATRTTDYAGLLGVQQTYNPYDGWGHVQYPQKGDGGPEQPERIQIVDAASVPGVGPAKPSGRAMRYEVRSYYPSATGDVTNTGGFKASRVECYDRHPSPGSTPAAQWPDPVGSTRWWGWSVLLPEGFEFATDSTWMTLTQFKGRLGGSPPQAVEMNRDRLRMTTKGGTHELGSVTPGRWFRLEVGIHLDPSSTDGWIEVWRDGNQVVSRRAVSTMDYVDGQVDPVYTKQGIYRSKSWGVTHTAFYGPLTIGTTRESVLQGAVTPSDGGGGAFAAADYDATAYDV